MANDERIGPTAHYTAYVWHRLGFPHAELFATAEGRRLFWGFRFAGEWVAAATPKVPSMLQYLEIRHRLIDHALEELAPDVVVELGAGLSRRGVTWARRGVDYVEVDLPSMVQEKRARIDAHAEAEVKRSVREHLTFAPLDVLGDGLAALLAAKLSGRRQPVVVAEGLLGYFAMEDRRELASRVAEALRAAGGGSLLCDLRVRAAGGRVAAASSALRLGIRMATRGRGAREDFRSHDEVRRFFEDAGFDIATTEDRAAVPHLAHLASPAAVWRATVSRVDE